MQLRTARARGGLPFFTADPLILGNVELATQNLAHWHSLTSVTRWCVKKGYVVHAARAVHVQTICTPP